jgi:hypothetical protein
MVMGNKIFKLEDTLVVIGAAIIKALSAGPARLDDLYLATGSHYPKKLKFDRFVYAVDFLYMIGKVDIEKDDVLVLR